MDGAGEGIDEGRRERWQTTQRTAPGEFSIYSLEYTTTLETFLPGDPTVAGYPVDYPLYLGTWRDHPEWKALVERRMYPGDLVVVTLYDGPGEDRKVVDRVTYSEKDVVNRAVDDVRACPYVVDLNGDGGASIGFNGGALPETPGLDPRFLSWWPDNTMGIDFYRSLPRKHPFYTGDRFGHANRWTATDGAYDDWAPSFGPWKDAATHWLDVAGGPAEYGHAFWGTPLRKNVFERQLNLGPTGGVLDPVPLSPDWDVAFGGWGLDWQTVRNRSFSSPQQVLEMPHLMMREQLSTSAGAGVDYAFARNVAERALAGQPELHAYNTTTGTPNVALNTDAVALAGSMTGDSIVLTCAQADFYPLLPGPGDIETAAGGADYHRWGSGTTYLPNAWVPIFLHPLGEAVTAPANDVFLQPYHWQPAINAGGIPDWRVQLNFLLAQPQNFPPGVTAADLAQRWPLWDRPVTFVSANMPNFDPRMDRDDIGLAALDARPAEALFVWDADDGLADGEYDVYVVTGDVELDLLRWGQEIVNARPNLTNLIEPTFGNEFMNTLNTDAAYLDDLAVDIEFFTDRGRDVSLPVGERDEGYGDGKVWEDANNNGFPDPGEPLLRAENEESFGMKYGATPNPEGVIHYGMVKVENNYLALFLRNWARPGMLNRFSRVVLAPRARSHGRININTAQMSPYVISVAGVDTRYEYNPMMGIPGVLAGFNAGTGLFGFLADTDNYGPSDPDVVAARTLAARIVEGRYAWPDGRYYRSVADLVAYDADTLGSPEGAAAARPLVTAASAAAGPEAQFLEMIGRYGRMANLISTYSDVFEIHVTAEAGYISNEDVNSDGQRDWRYDFVTTAQKKVRTIYER